MLRRIPRFLRLSVLVAVVFAVTISVYQSWSSGAPGTNGWVQTQWGPLGPTDRDLLVKVRLAGLWEGPTGQQAMQQAQNPQVREVGQIVSTEHAQLDADVRKVADQLGVLLPTSPSAQQLGWMKEISAATGSDYDRLFVQRLREAHGIVLPVIAQARVGTRNDLIRQFADEANGYVRNHITHLEATGLVDYQTLPAAPSPGLLSGDRSFQDLLVPIFVFVAALLAALGFVISLRRRAASRSRRPAVAPVAVPVAVPVPVTQHAIAALPGPRTIDEPTGSHRFPIGGRQVTQTGANRFPAGPSFVEHPSAPHRIPVAEHPSAPHESTGSHRFPVDGPPVESTGPRHVYAEVGAVEATGPRHAIRR